MNCPKCGAQMKPDASFCGVCGNRVDAVAPAASSAPEARIHIDEDSRGQGRGYSYEVLHQPAFSLAVVHLQAEQSIQAESGAMVSMSANIELQSQMKGGLFGAIKRAAWRRVGVRFDFYVTRWTRRSYARARGAGRYRRDRDEQSDLLCPIKFLSRR